MAKTAVENIILDIAFSTCKDVNNPNQVLDKPCENILQGNVDKDGFILDKESALLEYSENISGISKNAVIKHNWICMILLLIIGFLIVWFFLMKKTIDSNDDLIFIDNVFFNYCFLPICISLGFIVINVIFSFFNFIFWLVSRLKSNQKENNKEFVVFSMASIINPIFIQLAVPLNYLIIKMGELRDLLGKKGLWFSKSEEQSSSVISLAKIKDIPFIKYLALFYWRCLVLSSFVLLAFIILNSFAFCGHDHDYGFTITDTPNLKYFRNLHASLLRYDTYLDKLNERVLATNDSDVIKEYNLKNPSKLKLVECKNKKAFNELKDEYHNETDKNLNEFCFSYILYCLCTPCVIHLIYLIIIWWGCCTTKNDLAKKHEIRDEGNHDIIGVYQRNVLKNLKDQYKDICDKLVWFSNPEESSQSGITLSAFKNWHESKNNKRQDDEVRGEDYIFLSDHKDVGDWAVKDWINNQNKLSVRPYFRTLVCLCDINQPISTDCDNLNLISSLSNKDRYHIRIALVLDKNLIENYSADRDKVKSQLEQWKNELNSLKEGFSEEDKFFEKIVCVYSLNLPVPKMNFKEFNNQVNDYLGYRDLEDAFKFIFEKLELLTRKNVCLQISEKSNDSVDNLSNLKESIADDQDTLYFDNVQEMKNWVDNQNQFKECSLKRKLICLCDISQSISKDCFRQISRLENKDKFDIVISLFYNEDMLKAYPSQRDTIDSQLEQWKTELLSLKKEKFSETFVWVHQHADSDSIHNIINSAAEEGDANKNIEEAFNQITEILELQCHKYVWLTVSKLSEKSVVKQFELKNWCNNDTKNNVFLDGKNEVESWVEKYNRLEVPIHTRTLVCLCDVSQPVSKDIINQIALLSRKDKYDLVISLIYNDDLFKQYPSQRSTIDSQLEQWKLELLSLKKRGFSKTFICCRQINEPDVLPDEIINAIEKNDANFEFEEAFRRLKELFSELDKPEPPKQVSLTVQIENGLPDVTPVVPPEPQPYCMTLVIFSGVKKESFEETFNKFAGKAKNAPKRFYQHVSDPKILEDIDKDIQDDKVNNTAVYYRIALVAKVKSPFNEYNKDQLNDIIEKIVSIKPKQPLQVFVFVTEKADCRKRFGNKVDDFVKAYNDIVVSLQDKSVRSNVDYKFREFDYPIAGSDEWTNFCAEIFPDSDIKIVKLPSPEQRQKSFSKALDAIKISCKYAFKNSQDEKAQTGQIQDLNKAISDIYISNGGFFSLNFLDNVGNAFQDGYEKGKEIAQAGLEKGKDYVDRKIESLDRKIESLIKKYAPLGGAILGGCIGGLLGHPIIGIAVGYTAVPIKEYYDKRRKARIEEDPAFEEKPEDEQYRILQVEALIANGLLRTLVLDGQGYSEETISGTIQQVLQPLDKLHIYTEADMEKFLDEAKNRWEKRCLNNK